MRAPSIGLLFFLLAVLVLMPPAGAAVGDFDLAPLVAVRAQLVFRLVKTDRWDEQLFIATDGTVNGSLSWKPSLNSWMSRTGSGKGSPSQLATLKRALVDNHVGIHNGSCTVAVRDPWYGTYDLTWWGKGDRQSHLVAVVAQKMVARPPFCPPEVAAIIDAVERYGERTIGVVVLPDLR